MSADVGLVTSYCPDGPAASRAVLGSAAARRVYYDLDSPVTLASLSRGEPVGYLPAEGLGKWVAKADNGFRHSWAFTFQDFHEPIQIIERNSRILQDNCLRCHGDFVHNLTVGSTTAENPVFCVHCHGGVGHGP